MSAALVLEPLEQAFRDGIAAVHPIAPDVLELIGHACQRKQAGSEAGARQGSSERKVSEQDRTECIAELLAVEDLAQNLAAALAPQLATQARDRQPRVERVVPRRDGNGFTASNSNTREE